MWNKYQSNTTLTKQVYQFIAKNFRCFNGHLSDLWDQLLTKNEMDRIRRNYRFKRLSTLNKAELAAELALLIPLNFEAVIYVLDQETYDFIKKSVRNSGVIQVIGISISDVQAFMSFSILFPGSYEDRKILFMPDELLNVFSRVDNSGMKDIVRSNTEWMRLTHGLLNYYGVMEVLRVKERIEALTGRKIDLLEYMNVMSFACKFFGQARCTAYGYKDDRVFDPQKITEEHRMRQGVDYCAFTKRQLLRAGYPDYFDKTPEMNSFINFLSRHYPLTYQETNEIAYQITYIINMDSKPTHIIEYLQSWLEIPSFIFVRQLITKIMDVYNNTRQWALKGHTPKELHHEEIEYLDPLQTELFKTGWTDSDYMSYPNDTTDSTDSTGATGVIDAIDSEVIDLPNRTKVGRNDPCPCGSGKKFKKCCGK